MSVISNTTVISNFACVMSLDILRKLFGQIHISMDVYREIEEGLDEGYSFYAGIGQHIYPITLDGWIRLASLSSEDEIELFSSLPRRLHQGESSCIAIAQHRNWLFLTDDKAARIMARDLGISVTGSIGCLILAIERKLQILTFSSVV